LSLSVLSWFPTAGPLLTSPSSFPVARRPSRPLLCFAFPKTKTIIRATNLPISTLVILPPKSNHPRRSFLCRFASIETGLDHSLNSPAVSQLNVLLTTPPPPNPLLQPPPPPQPLPLPLASGRISFISLAPTTNNHDDNPLTLPLLPRRPRSRRRPGLQPPEPRTQCLSTPLAMSATRRRLRRTSSRWPTLS
ncbi:hypothetical protein CI238_07776, partial [Colletotrichum incanum]